VSKASIALAFAMLCLAGCAREPQPSERLLADTDDQLEAHHAAIRELNADYDATHEAFRAVFREFNARRYARGLFASPGTSSLLAAFEQAEVSIAAQIEGRTRRRELLAVTDRAEQAAKAGLATREETTEQLLALAQQPEGKSGELRNLLQRHRARTEVHQERLIRHRFELNGKMSREEWGWAFPPMREVSK
jgi:hypothetical protein